MRTPNEIRPERPGTNRDAHYSGGGGGNAESDVVSFWLLLLFIATFFGIAAEEARRPTMFQSATQASSPHPSPIAFSIDGTPLPKGAADERAYVARRFDLSSVDPESASSNAPGKLEIPATGK